MNIMHCMPGLPPARGGGMIKYAIDLAAGEQSHGAEVFFLIPGKFSRDGRTAIRKTSWKGYRCYCVQNPPLVTEGKRIGNVGRLYRQSDISVYQDFLKESKPDVIHVHSFMGLHRELLQSAKKFGIPTIYTTHDYYGLCPKATLLPERAACCKSDWSACAQCMGGVVSEKRLEWEHTAFCRRIKETAPIHWLEYSKTVLRVKLWLRQKRSVECHQDALGADGWEDYARLERYYKEMYRDITYFHFNSSQARRLYIDRLGMAEGSILHISNKSIKDNRIVRRYGHTLRIGYLTNRQPYKGYKVMMDALQKMYDNGQRDFECHIYMNEEKLGIPYIRSHEPYSECEMDKVYGGMDVLAVPSVWKETFGMVVPEALSYGVPVVISETVGAKDIVQENAGTGIIIDLEKDKNALYKALRGIYVDRGLLAGMNRAICCMGMDFDYGRHVEDMLGLYGKAMERRVTIHSSCE